MDWFEDLRSDSSQVNFAKVSKLLLFDCGVLIACLLKIYVSHPKPRTDAMTCLLIPGAGTAFKKMV